MRNVLLVADDSEANRSQLADALGESYVVCEADSGKDAISFISENGRKLCALLVNDTLQGSGAVSVLKFMCATSLIGKFPVLFISSFNLESDNMKEFSGDIDDIIEKPFNVDIIKRRVRNLVELYNYRRGQNNAELIT